mmetsp:Transcript_106468/g.306051  ORF Transcript_106468/g.306051 Transcript_106468/m.306051 type:complete len:125 (-) Transcript_106468:726-1100(-)
MGSGLQSTPSNRLVLFVRQSPPSIVELCFAEACHLAVGDSRTEPLGVPGSCRHSILELFSRRGLAVLVAQSLFGGGDFMDWQTNIFGESNCLKEGVHTALGKRCRQGGTGLVEPMNVAASKTGP